MHMKEDYMRNGQLKPGYNVNVATCSDFIIGSYISSDRYDVHKIQNRRLGSGLKIPSSFPAGL